MLYFPFGLHDILLPCRSGKQSLTVSSKLARNWKCFLFTRKCLIANLDIILFVPSSQLTFNFWPHWIKRKIICSWDVLKAYSSLAVCTRLYHSWHTLQVIWLFIVKKSRNVSSASQSAIGHFIVVFYFCIKSSLVWNHLLWKCVPPTHAKQTKTRFETEALDNSE